MASVLDLVKHYQHAIEKYPNDEQRLLKCIDKLFHLHVTVQHLQETGVGRTVNALRKEPGDVGQNARCLVHKWKLMVTAEESDQEGNHDDTGTTTYNGHNYVKDADSNIKQSKKQHDEYEKSKSTSKSSKKEEHKHMNGNHSSSKRNYQSSEEDEPDTKRPKHSSSSDNDNYKDKSNAQIKKETTASDSDEDSDDSRSENSDSDESESSKEEVKVKKYIKTEPSEKNKLSSSKHNTHIDHKRESSTSKKSYESDKHSKHHSTKSKDRHSSDMSSSKEKSHSSHRHQSLKEKVDHSEKKYKLEKALDSEKEHKESKSSSKHSSTDKHKSSSHKSDSDSNKYKSSKEKSDKHKSEHTRKLEKHKSSNESNNSEKEKHKSSSEREISSSKHKLKDSVSNSSKDKHSSSGKEKLKDKSSSSKEKSSSHSSEKKHSSSSSDSKSYNNDNKHQHDKSDIKNSEKKSKHKSSSSSHKSSKSSSSKTKEDEPKKKIKSNSEDSDDGIDCGSGASFAEALGMISPSKPKKKPLLKDLQSPNSFSADLSPAALLAPSAKLAPLPALEISALPEISPHYKPRPPPKLLPHFNEDDAMTAVISNKNQRTKVYSGNKVLGKIPSLYEMCVQVLQEHIDALEYTGGVPYEILKPVVDRATPQQLFVLEHYNPYLMEDTDHLWQQCCIKHFRNKQRQEMETWREMYMRCQEEQEHRLKSLTANIRIAQEAKKAPIKQTKMAYVDSVVKPPRNIARKQALHGTAHASTASPAGRVASLAAAPNVLRGGAKASVSPVVTSSSSLQKPKKAPLMQKALQLMRGRKR